jgi:hypothetical protein
MEYGESFYGANYVCLDSGGNLPDNVFWCDFGDGSNSAQCASGDIKAQWEGDSFCGISKSVSEAGGSSLRFDDKN